MTIKLIRLNIYKYKRHFLANHGYGWYKRWGRGLIVIMKTQNTLNIGHLSRQSWGYWIIQKYYLVKLIDIHMDESKTDNCIWDHNKKSNLLEEVSINPGLFNSVLLNVRALTNSIRFYFRPESAEFSRTGSLLGKEIRSFWYANNIYFFSYIYIYIYTWLI